MPDFGLPSPVNVINVGTSGAQYTKIMDAYNSISGSTPTVIQVAPGTYSLATADLLSFTKSNIALQGSGRGITVIQADSTVTGSTCLLQVQGAATGSSFSLTVNTAAGDTSLTISIANATTLNGQSPSYILVRSNKQPDTEFTSVHAGEIAKVVSVNTGTGVVTLSDELNDAYLTADSASIIQINMATNVKISDITFAHQATTSALTNGSLFFRFCSGLVLSNVECNALWWAGAQLSSCINSTVETCYMHNTQDPDAAVTNSQHYGIVVHAASKDVIIDTCQFSTLRHSITMGGQTGTNFEGMVRSVTSTNCTSETTDTAHYDTHQAAENIVYDGCTAIGGVPFTVPTGATGAFGFQCRSPKTTLVGCKCLRPKGKGIYVFGKGSNTTISGCTVDGCKQWNSAGGDSIYMDASITGLTITGCVITSGEGHSITAGGTGTNDLVIVGNTFSGNNTLVSGHGTIYLQGNNNMIVGNRFSTPAMNHSVQMTGTVDKWTIADNDFTGCTNPNAILVGTGSHVTNNMGSNPIGVITNPFTTSGSGDILNVSQPTNPAALPAIATTWTNRFTPKTITITGGASVVTAINGATVATASPFICKLGVGETINVTYSGTPVFKVYCE